MTRCYQMKLYYCNDYCNGYDTRWMLGDPEFSTEEFNAEFEDVNDNAKNDELVVGEVINDEDRRGHGAGASCSTGRSDGRDDRRDDVRQRPTRGTIQDEIDEIFDLCVPISPGVLHQQAHAGDGRRKLCGRSVPRYYDEGRRATAEQQRGGGLLQRAA
eukprot:3565823-Heterocapsa_arctica.AAC.1